MNIDRVALVILVTIILSMSSSMGLRCISCASSDYDSLYNEPMKMSQYKTMPKLFGPQCDSQFELQERDSHQALVECDIGDMACVTIFDIYYVGGTY